MAIKARQIDSKFPLTGATITLIGYYFALRRTAQKLRNGHVRWLEHNAEERASVGDATSERILRQLTGKL